MQCSGTWHKKLKRCPNIWSHNQVRQNTSLNQPKTLQPQYNILIFGGRIRCCVFSAKKCIRTNFKYPECVASVWAWSYTTKTALQKADWHQTGKAKHMYFSSSTSVITELIFFFKSIILKKKQGQWGVNFTKGFILQVNILQSLLHTCLILMFWDKAKSDWLLADIYKSWPL